MFLVARQHSACPYGYGSGPISIFELAMTAFSSRQVPSAFFEKSDNVSDLHLFLPSLYPAMHLFVRNRAALI